MNEKMVFVFGSNLRGVHGAGAAHYAMKHEGAQWGIGEGRSGNSYALPTKDIRIETLPIEDVIYYIERFIKYASSHMNEYFKVTRVGCGLAGFKDSQIAPLFMDAPDNCLFDTEWSKYLGDVNYWGTM